MKISEFIQWVLLDESEKNYCTKCGQFPKLPGFLICVYCKREFEQGSVEQQQTKEDLAKEF